MQLADGVTFIRIADTRIAHNVVTAKNTLGPATAVSGAINFTNVEARFRMTDSALAHNRVFASAPSGDASVDSGAGTLAGIVAHSRISDNSATARSNSGDATASGGGALMFGRMSDTDVADNSAVAVSAQGRARAAGGGLEVDFEPLKLRRTAVVGNSVFASGQRGFARGGGIFNWKLFSIGSRLTLIEAQVQGNAAQGSGEVVIEGGGIYARNRAVNSTASAISGNAPDQCFGC